MPWKTPCARFGHLERVPTLVLEALFVGERLLEAAVASRRTSATPPSPGPYVDRVHDVLRTMMSGTRSSGSSGDRVDRGVTGRVGSWRRRAIVRFEFAPSAGLAARGVGVELVRQRLPSLGEITSTTPRVRDVGGLVFEFVVAARATRRTGRGVARGRTHLGWHRGLWRRRRRLWASSSTSRAPRRVPDGVRVERRARRSRRGSMT